MILKTKLLQIPAMLFAFLLLISFQNCSPVASRFTAIGLSSSSNETNLKEVGNGGTYDGKPRILHHYVDQFRCEGREVPESILIQKNNKDWYLIQNTEKKCASQDQVPIVGVVYDDGIKVALYSNKKYVVPKPYFVLASAGPNLPDVNLLDGICADANGECSLAASIQQASVVSSNNNVIVHVPVGNYSLTAPLELQTGGSGFSITLRGADVNTVQLNGLSGTDILRIAGYSGAVVIENLSFINGNSSVPHHGSAITPSYQGSVSIINCLFTGNTNSPAIYVSVVNGPMKISNSRFISNGDASIQIGTSSGFILEDSIISNGGANGIILGPSYTQSQIRRTSVFNNAGNGISIANGYLTVLENISIYNNQLSGLVVQGNILGMPSLSLTLRNSTIFNNGLTAGGSLELNYYDPQNFLQIENSILATNTAARPNCTWVPTLSHRIVATNSIFDDSSCLAQGTGNLIANPLLGAAAMNGGLTPTLLPLVGSPAIDAGDNLVCAKIDQRNLPRPVDKLGQGLRCDIGAVEVQ